MSRFLYDKSYDNLGGEWGRGREVHEGGDICIPMADSC